MDSRVEVLLAGLERAGKRRTAQRTAICQVLVDHGGHPTAGELLKRVHGPFPMISQATVYNTMETLGRLGLIVPVNGADGRLHYDLDTRAHVNIICRKCGGIQDVTADEVKELMALVEARSGYDVERKSGITMNGICGKCRREG